MKRVLVTTSWDDGHKDDLLIAALLKKYGLTGTFYITPQHSEIESKDLLTTQDIKELAKDFEIGGHTLTHCNLRTLDEEKAFQEILDSKKYLESIVGQEIQSFCYPYGSYNDKTMRLVKRAGYNLARTTHQMVVQYAHKPFELGTSIEFTPTSLLGLYGHYKDAIKNKDFKLLKYLSFKRDLNAYKAFDYVYENGGVYHLWGHSSLITGRNDLQKLEALFEYISGKKDVEYLTNHEVIKPGSEEGHLQVIQTPARYHPYIGGVEKYVLDLSNELTKKGHAVSVVCANEPKSSDLAGPVEVKRLYYAGKIANTNITPTLFFELLRRRFDLMHTHIPTPWSADVSMVVALLKGRPLVVTYHNDILSKGVSGLIAALYNHTFLKLLLKRAAAIIVTQEKYITSSKYLSSFKDKITVIPNGVDMDGVKDLGVAKKPHTVFFLSSLDKYHTYKGLDVLLRAIAYVKSTNPDIQLLVGGDGELIDEYKRLTKELNIESSVTFLGRVDEAQKNRYYQESVMFILPSIGFEEGFGIVLLEAMANRTPVIATRYAGVADDVLAYNAGYVVEEKNPEDLAQKILLLTSNSALVSEMGKNGHALVNEKYAWEKVAQRMYELYARVI